MLLTLLFLVFASQAQSSSEVITKVEEALKSSSSKEISKYLHERLEIKLNSEKKEYSANQAEIMLKQFFQTNPSDACEFIHQGNSSGDIVYAIGKYSSGNSNYRVVVRAKKYKEEFKVYRLEFTKDR